MSWAGESGFESWQRQEFYLHNIQKDFWAQPASYPVDTKGTLTWVKRQWKQPKLTAHLHVVKRLRMSGATPSLPHMTSCHGAGLANLFSYQVSAVILFTFRPVTIWAKCTSFEVFQRGKYGFFLWFCLFSCVITIATKEVISNMETFTAHCSTMKWLSRN
jgi:hypothetical protein